MLRALIRKNWHLEDVFRPLPLCSLRRKPLLWGLLRYRTKAATVTIVGNAITASGVGLLLAAQVSIAAAVIASAIAGLGTWLLQAWYVNKTLEPVQGYLAYAMREYDEEVAWMKSLARDAVPEGEIKPTTKSPADVCDRTDPQALQKDGPGWEVVKDGWDVRDPEGANDKRARDGFCFVCEND